MKIPDQYLPVMPYLMLKKAGSFSEFMKEVFDAREQMIVPTESGMMHGEVRIGDALIMFADAGGPWKEEPAALYLYVEDVNETFNRAVAHCVRDLEKPAEKKLWIHGRFGRSVLKSMVHLEGKDKLPQESSALNAVSPSATKSRGQ